MKSSSVLTAEKPVIRWLRWAAALAFVCCAWGGLVYSAGGRSAWLAVVLQPVEILNFLTLREAAFVVGGALLAPRFRLATAIVLAAAHVPLSLWNHVLSRVSVDELVLLEGRANYMHFILETLGAVLGVVYIFWSEKTRRTVARVSPSQLSSEPPPGPAGAKAAPAAANTIIRWLRWAAVLAFVYSAVAELVYSALAPEAWARRPAPLAAIQEWVSMIRHYVLRQTAFVVAGALLAPRFRLATAIVLAAPLVAFSFWAHVLAAGGPWWSWTINYTHFSLEACGAVLGVVYIVWSDKAKRSSD